MESGWWSGVAPSDQADVPTNPLDCYFYCFPDQQVVGTGSLSTAAGAKRQFVVVGHCDVGDKTRVKFSKHYVLDPSVAVVFEGICSDDNTKVTGCWRNSKSQYTGSFIITRRRPAGTEKFSGLWTCPSLHSQHGDHLSTTAPEPTSPSSLCASQLRLWLAFVRHTKTQDGLVVGVGSAGGHSFVVHGLHSVERTLSCSFNQQFLGRKAPFLHAVKFAATIDAAASPPSLTGDWTAEGTRGSFVCLLERELLPTKESVDSDLPLSPSKTVVEEDKIGCVVCFDKPRCTLLVPCNHVCLCMDCAQRAKDVGCPLCRADIMSIVTVYL